MALTTYKELRVFQNALDACMVIFQLTKTFPAEERFALTDQVRRSSRSVCACLAEAWRKRRYPAAFAAKLDDAAGEASETQVWIELSLRCGYVSNEQAAKLDDIYEHVVSQLVTMAHQPEKWVLQYTPSVPPSGSHGRSKMAANAAREPHSCRGARI